LLLVPLLNLNKEPMPKNKPSVRANDPSEEHSMIFKLSDLEAGPNDKLEVFIEWHSGTYGSRVPSVVVRKA
jgi:hypothetical protein